MVYDFSPSRAGEHVRNFFGFWNGKLVCGDFAGYKAGFEKGTQDLLHGSRTPGVFDLHVASKNQSAEQELRSIGGLYEVEHQARDMSDEDKAAPISTPQHAWELAQRDWCPMDRQRLKLWITALNAR